MIQPATIDLPLRQTPVGPESVRAAYTQLRSNGWTEAEAGNLTALLVGLQLTRSGWRLHDVEGLLFIRSLVASGRLVP